MHLTNFCGGGQLIALKSATALILDRCHTFEMKKILLLTTTLFTTVLVAQTDFNQMILGTWELQERIDYKPIEKIDIFGTDSDSDKKDETEPDELFLFQKNGTVDVEEFGEQHKYDYQISDSTLRLGGVTYRIKWLTNDSLVLNRKEMITDEDLILTRSKKNLGPIQRTQKVQTDYPSGQMKLRGQKVNGFQHGIWTEWYENGRVKSVTHYQQDVPFMKIEFDEEGKITSKSWYDLESKKMKSE